MTETIAAPAPAYMLDVAQEREGRLSVVELNSFACSALYDCDPVPIVEAVRRMIARQVAEGYTLRVPPFGRPWIKYHRSGC